MDIRYYTCEHGIFVSKCEKCLSLLSLSLLKDLKVVAIPQYASIPHISIISLARALRWQPNGLESWSESDWACALAGEVGELCNVIKKRNRVRDHMQQRGTNEGALQHNLKMEIGDVYIYLDLLARRVGLDLEDCVRDTFNRISEREGFPERL